MHSISFTPIQTASCLPYFLLCDVLRLSGYPGRREAIESSVPFVTMARLSKNQHPPLSSRPSTSKRRANRLRNFTRSDVYEYQSHKVRRAHISLSLDKDEAHEHGAASDDDTDSNMRKPRLIGENVEDEDIPSEDDEELDSDAAFEESDDERFAGFSFPKVRCSPSLPFTTLMVCAISLGVRPRVKARSRTKTLIPQTLTTMTTIIL
jgi:hypothetical protein